MRPGSVSWPCSPSGPRSPGSPATGPPDATPEKATAQTTPSRFTIVAHMWLLSPLVSAATAASRAAFSCAWLGSPWQLARPLLGGFAACVPRISLWAKTQPPESRATPNAATRRTELVLSILASLFSCKTAVCSALGIRGEVLARASTGARGPTDVRGASRNATVQSVARSSRGEAFGAGRRSGCVRRSSRHEEPTRFGLRRWGGVPTICHQIALLVELVVAQRPACLGSLGAV